jgi:hypothetical protein
MITSSPSAFQYSAEERDSIAIAAPAKLNDADWCALQQIAATCPSAISAFSIKKLAPIEQASKKVGQLLEKASLAPDRYCIWSPDISALLKLICEQPFHAPTKGQWKSKSKRSNRARPDVLDDFLMRFVLFYSSRGGHAGKDPKSPCARFVIAAAGPALRAAGFEARRGTISNLIRARAHTFRGLTAVPVNVGGPEISKPTLKKNRLS